MLAICLLLRQASRGANLWREGGQFMTHYGIFLLPSVLTSYLQTEKMISDDNLWLMAFVWSVKDNWFVMFKSKSWRSWQFLLSYPIAPRVTESSTYQSESILLLKNRDSSPTPWARQSLKNASFLSQAQFTSGLTLGKVLISRDMSYDLTRRL